MAERHENRVGADGGFGTLREKILLLLDLHTKELDELREDAVELDGRTRKLESQVQTLMEADQRSTKSTDRWVDTIFKVVVTVLTAYLIWKLGI